MPLGDVEPLAPSTLKGIRLLLEGGAHVYHSSFGHNLPLLRFRKHSPHLPLPDKCRLPSLLLASGRMHASVLHAARSDHRPATIGLCLDDLEVLRRSAILPELDSR